MLVFEERGKPEYQGKNLSEQRREPTTNSTHIYDAGSGNRTTLVGGEYSPLRHPCSPDAIGNNTPSNSHCNYTD